MPWLIGYAREKIKWFPKIDHEKCVKCGMCMNCGKGVYEWTEKGPEVVQPYNCVIGCTTCGNLCLGNAISFPDIQEVREIYKKEGVWAKVRKELEEQAKLQAKIE